jgi:hypothetical protein
MIETQAPGIEAQEALLFVFHDSRRVRPWRVPHTAFRDPTRPDARLRESIELCSVAYFW